jgi:hypothetical protein
MKKEILYVTALNEHGILVKANDSEKTGNYFCPVCKSELILKKSGKVGKGSKRPHFAHYTLTENCTPESALHYSFKRILVEKINDFIKNNIPINIAWKCNYCLNKHEGNLLKIATDVKEEYYMNTCKPDIALLNNKGNVFAVVEIVVTHKPEENVIKYYKDNNIILIQIDLDSDNDLDNIDGKLNNPSIVDFCFNPKCKNCGNYKTKNELVVLNESCYRCGNPMNICYISTKDDFKRPSEFNEYEINFAKSKGVLLEIRFSKTVNGKYLANVCPTCKAFIGDHPLFDNYILENIDNENIPKYNIGYYCEKCNYETQRHGHFA